MNEKNEPKINLEEVVKEAKQDVEENKQDEALSKLKNDLLLALAEAENLRKRHAKEKEDLSKFAVSSALSELATPFEHLFSALKLEVSEDLRENPFVKSMFEGVLMVQKEFEKVFNKLGLKRIYPEGGSFDPNFHQAVSQIEVQGFDAGAIVQVVSAGFELNGRVLKPAMVVVAK
jgi:molecular chaperone GrpE